MIERLAWASVRAQPMVLTASSTAESKPKERSMKATWHTHTEERELAQGRKKE